MSSYCGTGLGRNGLPDRMRGAQTVLRTLPGSRGIRKMQTRRNRYAPSVVSARLPSRFGRACHDALSLFPAALSSAVPPLCRPRESGTAFRLHTPPRGAARARASPAVSARRWCRPEAQNPTMRAILPVPPSTSRQHAPENSPKCALSLSPMRAHRSCRGRGPRTYQRPHEASPENRAGGAPGQTRLFRRRQRPALRLP
jgi:hypothetical protein